MANVNDAIASQLMTDLMSDYGLSWQQAAGLVGNLAHESAGFNTLQEISPVVEGSRGGYGFAQWTGSRRDDFDAFVERNGLDPTSYAANYLFLKEELDGDYKYIVDGLKTKDTVSQATKYVSNNYLRPGVPHMTSRQALAKEVSVLPVPMPAARSPYIQAMQSGNPVPPMNIPNVPGPTNPIGAMPSRAELAAFSRGPLPAPAPLTTPSVAPIPLDMAMARSSLPSSIVPSLNGRSPNMPTFDAAYSPAAGAMVMSAPTQHLGAALMDLPAAQPSYQAGMTGRGQPSAGVPAPSYQVGMEGRGQPSSRTTAEGFAVNPVQSVSINPTTGMPYSAPSRSDSIGSMPSFGGLANFATNAPSIAPPTSVASMYGGTMPSTSAYAPSRSDGIGTMPAATELSSWAGARSEVPGVTQANSVVARADGSYSPISQAGSVLGPAGKPSGNYLPTVPAPAAPQTVTSQVANPAYAQWMASGANAIKAQEMAAANKAAATSPYFQQMARGANSLAQSKPLPLPPVLAAPPKTITVTRTLPPPVSRALPPRPAAAPVARASNAIPMMPAAPSGGRAIGTAAGYLYGSNGKGGYVNLGLANPDLTPAQAYAQANAGSNSAGNGTGWQAGVPGTPGYEGGTGRYD